MLDSLNCYYLPLSAAGQPVQTSWCFMLVPSVLLSNVGTTISHAYITADPHTNSAIINQSKHKLYQFAFGNSCANISAVGSSRPQVY